MSLSDTQRQTSAYIQRFRAIELKPWGIEATLVELLAECGTLADYVMQKEGYRKPRDGNEIADEELGDAISDIMFILFMIAEHFNIDMDKAYANMLAVTDGKLRKRGA